MEDTLLKKYRTELAQLREDAETWRTHWKEIAEYMFPRKGRYLTNPDEESNSGKKKHSKIINGSANDALRIIAAGMQGGLTSPSRPWFSLTLADEDLMEIESVRNWLHNVRNSMLAVYARSNFYGSLHGMYKELAAFGTAVMLIEEDFETVIRARPMTIGEFFLSLNSKYRPDTLYRQFSMTARQMIEDFGEDNVSDQVKSAMEADKGETRFEVIHCIYPNAEVNTSKDDYRGKAFASVYFEFKNVGDNFLKRSGYDSIPFVAPRWDITGVDVYGNSPGMEALGDVKMLQKMEEKKLKALDKMVDPPMNAPTELKKKGGTIVAGGVNYIDVAQGQQGFTPAYQVTPNTRDTAFEIDRVELRIRRFFFNDLFLSVLATDKKMTATEVSHRYEEKMLMLGPVLERLQAELLDPMIERTFEIMTKFNLLPPPPKEIAGREIEVKYISLLAQAQKMVGITGIEQTSMFVGTLAGVNPEVVDKLDFDEAVDQYADMVGVPPKIIRSDDKVLKMREQRAAQQAQAQEAVMAAQRVDNAKKLSETKVGENNALDNIMGGESGDV